jgi:hypothetical protein
MDLVELTARPRTPAGLRLLAPFAPVARILMHTSSDARTGMRVPELASYNGLLWYRTTFILSKQRASQRAMLSLGTIDEVDETWVNGVPVGYTAGAGTETSTQS